MNNYEYLKEISKSNRQVKSTASGPNTGLILKILGAGALLVAILILIVTIIASQGKAQALARQVSFRSNNLSATLNNYNSYIKSPQLRAIGISLKATIDSGESQINSYFISQDQETAPTEDVFNSETELVTELNITLENARLNGILDRIYANQIQLQTSLLLSLLSTTLQKAEGDETLYPIIEQYHTNLSIIDQEIDKYSNPSA